MKNLSEKLNKVAKETLKNLEEHHYFNDLELIDNTIRSNQDPLDQVFYKRQQDELTEIYGELLKSYGELLSVFLSYIATRKYEMLLEYSQNKYITVNETAISISRAPGEEILEELAKSEITDLYETVILLEKGWLKRIENSIQTCRNHTYGGNNNNAVNKY